MYDPNKMNQKFISRRGVQTTHTLKMNCIQKCSVWSLNINTIKNHLNFSNVIYGKSICCKSFSEGFCNLIAYKDKENEFPQTFESLSSNYNKTSFDQYESVTPHLPINLAGVTKENLREEDLLAFFVEMNPNNDMTDGLKGLKTINTETVCSNFDLFINAFIHSYKIFDNDFHIRIEGNKIVTAILNRLQSYLKIIEEKGDSLNSSKMFKKEFFCKVQENTYYNVAIIFICPSWQNVEQFRKIINFSQNAIIKVQKVYLEFKVPFSSFQTNHKKNNQMNNTNINNSLINNNFNNVNNTSFNNNVSFNNFNNVNTSLNYNLNKQNSQNNSPIIHQNSNNFSQIDSNCYNPNLNSNSNTNNNISKSTTFNINANLELNYQNNYLSEEIKRMKNAPTFIPKSKISNSNLGEGINSNTTNSSTGRVEDINKTNSTSNTTNTNTHNTQSQNMQVIPNKRSSTTFNSSSSSLTSVNPNSGSNINSNSINNYQSSNSSINLNPNNTPGNQTLHNSYGKNNNMNNVTNFNKFDASKTKQQNPVKIRQDVDKVICEKTKNLYQTSRNETCKNNPMANPNFNNRGLGLNQGIGIDQSINHNLNIIQQPIIHGSPLINKYNSANMPHNSNHGSMSPSQNRAYNPYNSPIQSGIHTHTNTQHNNQNRITPPKVHAVHNQNSQNITNLPNTNIYNNYINNVNRQQIIIVVPPPNNLNNNIRSNHGSPVVNSMNNINSINNSPIINNANQESIQKHHNNLCSLNISNFNTFMTSVTPMFLENEDVSLKTFFNSFVKQSFSGIDCIYKLNGEQILTNYNISLSGLQIDAYNHNLQTSSQEFINNNNSFSSIYSNSSKKLEYNKQINRTPPVQLNSNKSHIFINRNQYTKASSTNCVINVSNTNNTNNNVNNNGSNGNLNNTPKIEKTEKAENNKNGASNTNNDINDTKSQANKEEIKIEDNKNEANEIKIDDNKNEANEIKIRDNNEKINEINTNKKETYINTNKEFNTNGEETIVSKDINSYEANKEQIKEGGNEIKIEEIKNEDSNKNYNNTNVTSTNTTNTDSANNIIMNNTNTTNSNTNITNTTNTDSNNNILINSNYDAYSDANHSTPVKSKANSTNDLNKVNDTLNIQRISSVDSNTNILNLENTNSNSTINLMNNINNNQSTPTPNPKSNNHYNNHSNSKLENFNLDTSYLSNSSYDSSASCMSEDIYNKKVFNKFNDNTFSFFEDQPLHNRPCFINKIEELFKNNPFNISLDNLNLSDISESSWFSVLYTPIRSIKPNKGITNVSFIVYYRFRSKFISNTIKFLPIVGLGSSRIDNEFLWFSNQSGNFLELKQFDETVTNKICKDFDNNKQVYMKYKDELNKFLKINSLTSIADTSYLNIK